MLSISWYELAFDIPKYLLISFADNTAGKSSFAFDTVYAEGQRRYVESLSAYARNFLEQMKKPEVDSITGLSPAIAIDQKSTSRNPRSTVGTVTEIYDYLRLLFAKLGTPNCPKCNIPVKRQTIQEIMDTILNSRNGQKIMIDLSDGVMVNDATVPTADIEASNGVIHVIDKVLVPDDFMLQ